MKREIKHERKCPTCRGTGVIRTHRRIVRYPDTVREEARALFRRGKSLRYIAKKVGIKPPHPQKVMSLINAKTL